MKVGLALLWLAVSPVAAQEFSALARLDVEQSGAQDRFRRTQVDLFLSQPVPYRVFTLDDPRRVVLDFREVDFRGAQAGGFAVSDRIDGARFGGLRPGWSRMILDLAAPVFVDEAGMVVDDVDGTARITLVLRPTGEAEFAAAAGAPDDPDWVFSVADTPAVAPVDDGPVVVVIDPGHGGIDPGAEHGGTQEAEVMLALATELATALGRLEDVHPVVTRSGDNFVPLQERLTLARGAGADLFISLHADALEGEQATGASVYTLTDEAASQASQRMAERHNAGDLLAGIDLSGQGDEVAMILQDLARIESAAAGDRFADQLVQAMQDTGAPLNTRPRRAAPLAVLNAADFPSVLLEVGFLSNEVDRARLTSPQGRAPIVAAVTLAVGRWVIEEAALAPLVRQ
ncbi:N-acetylmuramoyl-L-alanine amidase [Pseudooctadecabacter sp.]|uniref:N-acetylmuramoyl-L-alanine amidase n=1 Tax=Pseudooctadecabacter sp. TaxID=1966338 RepID=UPI00260025D4|nr:N-acetylmuramoyl-L-alanine amidase [Pseudooctadecabacter sp.]